MKNKLVLFSLTIIALIVSACASAPVASPYSKNASLGSQSTTVPSAGVASGQVVVDIGQTSSLGSFVVDSKGMTLYLYTVDTPNTSNCYGGCAGYWPPLLTTGAPIAGSGVTASLLGTTTRTDGTVQVTYNGHPLYYYASDKVAGDVTGEAVQGVWFVITPAGVQK
jgi:predicted lipoprotein with Yx(FWY)xxD motif